MGRAFSARRKESRNGGVVSLKIADSDRRDKVEKEDLGKAVIAW
jgi:hypothetical protein